MVLFALVVGANVVHAAPAPRWAVAVLPSGHEAQQLSTRGWAVNMLG